MQYDPESSDSHADVEGDAPKLSMTDDFLAFHHANPHVYLTLRDLAHDWVKQGKTKCSITLFYNVARWKLSLRTQGDEQFELNDHYQAYYSRALMHYEPLLTGMFNIRRAPEADAWAASLPPVGRAA